MRAERVVLIDDSETFRLAAAAALRAEGLSIIATAETAEDGEQMWFELGADLLLVDLHLPGMDGVDLAWRLQGGPDIILISSHDEAAVDPRVLDAPVRGFLPKEELTCEAVRSLLR